MLSYIIICTSVETIQCVFRLHSFVTNVCQGNKEILHEIVSFIIEPDHLLFLVPPSVYHEAPIQIIMEPNESIMIRFVLNKSIKAVGIKIFDIEPGTKQFWKSAEIFAIPIQKSKETMKICQIYNIQDSENSQYNLNENKMGIPAVSDNIITNFYQQLLCHKYAFHEHQDSDTSLGFLFKNSIVLNRNTLYCIRIRLNAASKNNVFVNKSFVHIFKERPLYNYRYALFRSLQFCLPATMNFVPNIAVMAKTCL